MMNFKRTGLVWLSVMLLAFCVLAGCSSGQDTAKSGEAESSAGESTTDAAGSNDDGYTTFTDSTGREVQVPKKITKVVASGISSQIVLFAICPDILAANSFDEDAAFEYIDKKYQELPMIGQIYGGKTDFNMEELIKIDPDVVIDIGEGKDSIKEDMDDLTEKTGIPFVHIECTLSTADKTFEQLGELLDRPDEAKELADYCRSTYDKITELAEKVDKKKALYITYFGDYGVIAKDSFHAECFDMLADNVAVLDEVSNKGTGSQVDFEQIVAWDPQLIIVGGTNTSELLEDERFQALEAVQNKKCYIIPVGPFNWLNNPPSVQRYLGMLWLADTFYPEDTDYDLYDEANTYFKLFYHRELPRETFEKIKGTE